MAGRLRLTTSRCLTDRLPIRDISRRFSSRRFSASRTGTDIVARRMDSISMPILCIRIRPSVDPECHLRPRNNPRTDRSAFRAVRFFRPAEAARIGSTENADQNAPGGQNCLSRPKFHRQVTLDAV